MVKKALSILIAILGVIGAAISVGMLIAAIKASEWGRVLLYCVTLAVSVELAVLNILNLRSNNEHK